MSILVFSIHLTMKRSSEINQRSRQVVKLTYNQGLSSFVASHYAFVIFFHFDKLFNSIIFCLNG